MPALCQEGPADEQGYDDDHRMQFDNGTHDLGHEWLSIC